MSLKDDLPDHWWDKTYDELSEYFGVSRSTIGRWKNELELPEKTEWNRVEYTHGVSMERVLYHLHHDALFPTTRMADALDISRGTLADWFQQVDVHKRSQSEAETLKHEQMTEAERRERTQAARERLPDGGGLVIAWEERYDEMRSHTSENGSKGASARERNGMLGVTGQDHPRWRGGKSIYDAVKKQLGNDSWHAVRLRNRRSCRMCGADEDIHVHHIVPLLAGGCNADTLLMSLCRSCHRRAEAFTRSIPECCSCLVP